MSKVEKIARATYLRDAAIQIVRREGKWQEVIVDKKPIFVMGANSSKLSILYTTPFQKLPEPSISKRLATDTEKYDSAAGLASMPKREAFLLDIWDNQGKVLSVAWDDGKPIHIVFYRKKDWESDLDEWSRTPAEQPVVS
jgi:hypothetical protein